MADGFTNQQPVANSIADNAIGSAIGGVLSTRPSARYVSGARCILKVNGQLIGFAFGISWNINNSITRINTIDDYNSWELAPKRVDVTGTISCLHIPGQGAGASLMQADVLSFLFQNYITIECRDSRTNQLLFLTDKAMVTSRNQSVSVESLSTVTLNWEAIGYQDERTPNPPTGYNVVNPVPPPPTAGGAPSPIPASLIPSSPNLAIGVA